MAEEQTQSEDTIVDRRSADIGIVCSFAAEVKPLLKKIDRIRKYSEEGAVFRGGFLDESLRIAVVEAGSGFARHRRAAETLVREHCPSWVLSIGFSSSLIPELKSGDVTLASEIADTHGNSIVVNCPVPETKRVLVRKHVVADQHPVDAAERLKLAEQWDACAVDTTSLAVAQACQPESENEKPLCRFLSIRGIIGESDEDLSPEVTSFVFVGDSNSKPAGFGSVWQKLKPNPALAPWKKQVEGTAANLNRFTLGVIEQLGEKIRSFRN